jgi:hypothetical protein
MSGPDQQNPGDEPVNVGNQEPFQATGAIELLPPNPGLALRPKKKSTGLLIFGLFGVLVLAMGALVMLTQKNPDKPKTPIDSDDLGAGIANASGLRGHLVTRWQNKAQYMLKIEPLDPRENDGFAAVSANPPGPIYINIRLLDSSGFALCGKEIVLHYDPARSSRVSSPAPKNKDEAENLAILRQADLERVTAQEKSREIGNDTFQNVLGSDGAVEGLWAQGDLPCSPDQYKRFDYWDLSTNFPTLAEQDQLLGRHHTSGSAESDQGNSQHASGRAPRSKAPPKPQSAFYMEGDDRATAFEPGRNLLTIGPGKSFTVVRTVDVATAAAWADDSSLVHYTCDQHAACSLRRAGSSTIILGKMNE